MKKRDIYVIIIIATIFAITIGITVMIYKINQSKISQNYNDEPKIINSITNNENKNFIDDYATEKTSVTEEKVSPNALIIFNRYYKGCNHTTKRKENVTEKMVNKTKEEIEDMYFDWELIGFKSNEIELYKEFDGECDEHYIVKEDDGIITIFKTDENGNERIVERTEISTNYLPEQDVEVIKNGVSIYGRENLNAYLENFE